jgi:multidrug resistance protein, MATE family
LLVGLKEFMLASSGVLDNGNSEKDVYELCCGEKSSREGWRIARLARPLLWSYLAHNVSMAIAVAFVGHYSTEDLAAMMLAHAILFGTLVFVTGVCGAGHTLCSQAHSAAQDALEMAEEVHSLQNYTEEAKQSLRSIGIWLQVSIVWPSVILLPAIIVVWACTGEILASWGACEGEVCAMASSFATISILWLYPFHVFNAISVYLESLEIILPQTVLSMVFIVLNFPLYYFFVFTCDLGVSGAAWASVVSNLLQLACLVYYVWGREHRLQEVEDTWTGWSREVQS